MMNTKFLNLYFSLWLNKGSFQMSENLNVDKIRNGDPIQEAKTDDE